MFLYIEWLFWWVQVVAPIQLISFWFHEICMGYQQALGGELWFPGDVARYGGGIQIMHCSKLAPCVFSLLRCSKNTVMALRPKSFRLWKSDSKSCALSQMFLHLFRHVERLPCWFNPSCVDSKMYSCPELMNGPLRRTNIHNLCHLPLLWWKLSQRTSQPLTMKNKVSCSFSQLGV